VGVDFDREAERQAEVARAAEVELAKQQELLHQQGLDEYSDRFTRRLAEGGDDEIRDLLRDTSSERIEQAERESLRVQATDTETEKKRRSEEKRRREKR
jgi:hypothetical protein